MHRWKLLIWKRGSGFVTEVLLHTPLEKLLMLLVLKLNGPLLAIAALRDAPAALQPSHQCLWDNKNVHAVSTLLVHRAVLGARREGAHLLSGEVPPREPVCVGTNKSPTGDVIQNQN